MRYLILSMLVLVGCSSKEAPRGTEKAPAEPPSAAKAKPEPVTPKKDDAITLTPGEEYVPFESGVTNPEHPPKFAWTPAEGVRIVVRVVWEPGMDANDHRIEATYDGKAQEVAVWRLITTAPNFGYIHQKPGGKLVMSGGTLGDAYQPGALSWFLLSWDAATKSVKIDEKFTGPAGTEPPAWEIKSALAN